MSSAYKDKYTPMFIPNPPGLVTAAISSLSTKRLSNYRKFFAAKDDNELYGLYCWNEAISMHLFKLISTTEVALRNQFHKALSQFYGVVGAADSKDWYNFLQLNHQSAKSLGKISHYRRKGRSIAKAPQPSPDDVVANLTFGFWPHLLDVSLDTHGGPVDWGVMLPQVVPGHRQKTTQYWQKQAEQDQLFARIDLVNELRNRVAHHEPIWKAGPLLEETRDRPTKPPRTVVAAAPTTEAEVVTRLSLLYDRTLELLNWCTPALANIHRQSETYAQFKATNSIAGIDSHRDLIRYRGDFDIAQHKKLSTLKRDIKRLKRNGQSVRLLNSGAPIGHLTVHD